MQLHNPPTYACKLTATAHRRLDLNAILLLSCCRRFQRHPVDDAIAASPQLWPALAKEWFVDVPELLVLCQPIEDPEGRSPVLSQRYKAPAASQPRPQQASRSGSAQTAQLLQASTALARAGLRADTLAGLVGDTCCGGAGAAGSSGNVESKGAASAVPPPPPKQAELVLARLAAAKQPPSMGISFSHGCSAEQTVQYCGLVVQSRVASSVEGTYVLKTVRNVDYAVGCHCTHYSLTRVSRGEALHRQLQGSWLV